MLSPRRLLAAIFPTLSLGIFTSRHMGILLVLFISDAPLNLFVVASILKIGKPPCSRIAGNLCERGLVRSKRPESDRRHVLLSLTESGRAFVMKMLGAA